MDLVLKAIWGRMRRNTPTHPTRRGADVTHHHRSFPGRDELGYMCDAIVITYALFGVESK